MRIAILGATSEIAKDYVRLLGGQPGIEAVLFARRPDAVHQWLESLTDQVICEVADFDAFGHGRRFDAVLNFVGIGDPSKAADSGPAIVETSSRYDELALAYLKKHPDCRYVFFSSGAVYGSRFDTPVEDESSATIPINHLRGKDWYGVAKLLAECRHRSLEQAAIIDLRIFNYFSQAQNLSPRFLINDILNSIERGTILQTTPANIVRDYLHPEDLFQLISLILDTSPANRALDCFSKAPVSKFDLLQAMERKFGLRYEVIQYRHADDGALEKMCYYSLSRRAAQLGYTPCFTSLECVLEQSEKLLAR